MMGNEEQLAILWQGVEVWNAWRREYPRIKPNLFRVNLRGADLRRVNLRWANLQGADLQEANFEGASLFGSNLKGAHLQDANFEGVNLQGANLQGANLYQAKMRWARFQGASMQEANLQGADLRETHFFAVDLQWANLQGANLSRADLQRVNLQGADLRWTNFFRADLQAADLQAADLSNADIQEAKLSGANLRRVKFQEVDLTGVDLTGAYLDEGIRLEFQQYVVPNRGIQHANLSLYPLYRQHLFPTSPIHFTVFHPEKMKSTDWYELLVYIHFSKVIEQIQSDCQIYLRNQANTYQTVQSKTISPIARGAEVTIVLEVQDCHANPPRTSILWLEDWHRVIFRLQALPQAHGFSPKVVEGRVLFYVDLILIAEVHIQIELSEGNEIITEPLKHVTVEAYQSIFVSYSHKDISIVERLERAYSVLGMKYLRDIHILRSGEKWNPALLGAIEEADIFQLCWSYNAQRSKYVRQEWQHALNLNRPNFIRPVYWEQPIPKPPRKLNNIHFAYYQLPNELQKVRGLRTQEL